MIDFSIDVLDIREQADVKGVKVVLVWKFDPEKNQKFSFPASLARLLSGNDVLDQKHEGATEQKAIDFIQANKFDGENGKALFYPRSSSLAGDCGFLFVGLGQKQENVADNMESFRAGLGTMVKEVEKLELKQVAIFTPEMVDFVDNQSFKAEEFVQDFVSYLKMLSYKFEDFKSTKSKKLEVSAQIMLDEKLDLESKAVEHGKNIGDFVNFARKLSDFPPNVASPSFVTNAVLEEVKKLPNVTYKVIEQDEAKALGMGGFCAVGSGSANDSKMVILEYSGGLANAPKIALVGKGVTFDTGGVSLKPADSMGGMKYDMTGAAVVLSTLLAAAKSGYKVNLVAIAPLVENMPDGNSYRQDDIITFYNGKTAEIVNTDAEGRVILADALAYVEKNYNPSVIIDVATLTGACIVALGHVFAAVLSTDDQLTTKLILSGSPIGEWLWRLPLHKSYARGIKSEHADMSNCGAKGFGAGTITAACFLQNFVEKAAWAHLDIAGKDSMIPNSPHASSCSSGFGVRLLLRYLKNTAN